MATSGSQRQREWGTGTMGSSINQKSALSAAYAELGKELNSGKLKSIGSYTLGKMIGEGTYGKVRLGTHRLTGTKVAIKQVPKAHSASLTREIHHHRRLHHPNVMQLYEVLATESYIWMVTELCPGGELYDYLVERGVMPEAEARRIFGQLCLAVAYVHDRGIVHRDLKLENVLLDERCNVKLGDFGFTREFESKKLMETFCGTTGYAAPEMLAGRKYTGEEVDVWSLGVILYALLCGALPFDDDDEMVMKGKIMKGDFELPEELSEESRDLITSILQQNPSSRPSIKAILNHPWFSKIIIGSPMATVEENEVSGQAEGYFHGEEARKVEQMPSTSQEEPKQEEGLQSPSNNLALPEVSSKGELSHRGSSSAFSETSFYSAKSKSDSESSDRQSSKTDMTDPTTEEGDGEALDIVSLDIAPNVNAAERGALALHRNESQTTIRREGSSGSEASRKAVTAAAASTSSKAATLPTHHEAPSSPAQVVIVEESSPQGSNVPLPSSVALEKRSSQSSSRGGHHRTPSRTKRSSSGGLSEHVAPILDFRPTDYVALLERSTPAMFSTVVEQNILHQLSSLGLDVGQIVHSVVNEACDASGAMWWILKKKAEERQQDADLQPSPLFGHLSLTSPPPPLPPKDPSRGRFSASPAPLITPSTSHSGRSLVKPAPVYSSGLSLGTPNKDAVSPSKEAEDGGYITRSVSPSTTFADSPSQTPLKASRPVERRRASSFTVRLSNVLAGKDKESRKDTADSVFVGEEQLTFAERSKSPVGTLLTKIGGGASPALMAKEEKDKRKESSRSPQGKEANNKSKGAEDRANERASISSRSSPMRSSEDQVSQIQQSKSMETFSTVSSNVHEEGGDTSAPNRGKNRPSFLSAVRTWFEDKDKGGTMQKKKKQQQQQSQQHAHQLGNRHDTQHRNGKASTAPPAHANAGLHGQTKSRNGSIRRTSASGSHPPIVPGGSAAKRSPRQTMNNRGSLSRRSSSGSGHYPLPNMASTRPKNTRRQSAGSITPTGTMNGEELAHALQHHRVSRPSSAQSSHVPFHGGMHGKSGSASSTNSALRHQQNSGSLRSVHGRRSSADGGTTVRRHRHYPSSHHHHHRSESRSHSRPSTPSKLGLHSVTDEEEGVYDVGGSTPRRSFDSEGHQGRRSPLHTPRASHSVFVAHKSRTPYKPPSSNAALHRHERDAVDHHHLQDRTNGTASHLGTWRRSWGKPPPCWNGPVDHPPTMTAGSEKMERPKLRDVFANRESDDDWEDEEEEPMYAGGLGQLDSIAAAQSWSSQARSKGSGANTAKEWDQFPRQQPDGVPNQFFGANRYAGVRSIFQPPNLGKETSPRAWTMEGEESSAGDESKPAKDAGASATKDAAISSGGSRVRAAAPAFKGADILEEEEEEEE